MLYVGSLGSTRALDLILPYSNRELSLLLPVHLLPPPPRVQLELLLLLGLVSMAPPAPVLFSKLVSPSPSLPVVGLHMSVRIHLNFYVCVPVSLLHSQKAWYEWFPAASHDFSGITISAGDDIKLTVTATSKTTGTAMVENLTNGQTVSANLTSSTPLCEQDAEWIVEDYMEGFRLVPFANFSTVTFTNAEATGTGIYTPSGANITDIKQNGKTLTSVSTSGSSVTIDYV